MTDAGPVAAAGAPDPRAGGADPLRAAAEAMHSVRDRCVWTQQIDHRALVPYLVEESAELIDAVETGSRAELREELGDLLWQVLFHAEIASRDPDDPFDIDDVARGLTDKMVRRHPHVFGDAVATTPEEVLVLWNAAKAAEKHTRTSVLDGVSPHMPSLALAQKLLGKAQSLPLVERVARLPVAEREQPRPVVERAQRDETHPSPVDERAQPSPVVERAERDETHPSPVDEREQPRPVVERAERDETPTPASEAELGDALLALVAIARAHGWDAERALRERLRVLETDIRSAEADLRSAEPDADTEPDAGTEG